MQTKPKSKPSGGKWKYGIVTEIDPDKMMVRCQLPDMGNIITPWLLLAVSNSLQNKDYYLPDVGEQLVILLDENSETGCAIGAVYSTKDTPAISNLNKRRVDFEDGTSIEYDRETHVLEIKVDGDITIEATGTITLKAPRIDLNP
jgi:phage baseplate assembly protein V